MSPGYVICEVVIHEIEPSEATDSKARLVNYLQHLDDLKGYDLREYS